MMMGEPKVLISVLNWNNSADTIRCIYSLKKLSYTSYTILVVDNGSKDNSVLNIKNEFPEIQIIKSSSNLGYAGGNRLACEWGAEKGFDLFWIVNNDSVVESNCLHELVKAYTQKGEGLFGGVSLNEDNETISFSGGFELDNSGNVLFNKYSSHRGEHKNIFLTKETITEMADVNGACMMVPYSIIMKYGFIDNSFFLYGEELDYCFKLRKEAGIKSFLVTTAVVTHEGSTSLNKNEKLKRVKTYYLTRNYSYFEYNYRLRTKMEIIHSLNSNYRKIINTFFMKLIKNKEYFLTSDENAAALGLYDFACNKKGKVFEPNDYV
jgi:GT2 family glycosyltransferase